MIRILIVVLILLFLFLFIIMFRRIKGRLPRIAEYMVLCFFFLWAFFSIQSYIKRGVRSRYLQATDDVGDQFTPGRLDQLNVLKAKNKISGTLYNKAKYNLESGL